LNRRILGQGRNGYQSRGGNGDSGKGDSDNLFHFSLHLRDVSAPLRFILTIPARYEDIVKAACNLREVAEPD
jgi:hypothetical protein